MDDVELARDDEAQERFIPYGALTFFALMLIGFTILWFDMYINLFARE